MDDFASKAERLRNLNERQREVLQLLCEGHTIAEIGQILFTTPRNVLYHVGNIYTRLEIDQLDRSPRRMELGKFCVVLRSIPEENALVEQGPDIDPPEPPEQVLALVRADAAELARRSDEHALSIRTVAIEESLAPIPIPPMRRGIHPLTLALGVGLAVALIAILVLLAMLVSRTSSSSPQTIVIRETVVPEVARTPEPAAPQVARSTPAQTATTIATRVPSATQVARLLPGTAIPIGQSFGGWSEKCEPTTIGQCRGDFVVLFLSFEASDTTALKLNLRFRNNSPTNSTPRAVARASSNCEQFGKPPCTLYLQDPTGKRYFLIDGSGSPLEKQEEIPLLRPGEEWTTFLLFQTPDIPTQPLDLYYDDSAVVRGIRLIR